MKEIPEFIQKIDWKLLREQKHTLLSYIKYSYYTSEPISKKDEHLQGLVHLIDALQDFAVDELGIPEEDVFKLD